MKACFLITERRQSYAKIQQTSVMKACFLITERRISYAKIQTIFKKNECRAVFYRLRDGVT